MAQESAKSLKYSVPMPIEFYFSPETVNSAIEKGKLTLKTKYEKARAISKQFNLSELIENELEDELHYFAYDIDKDAKDEFSKWVIKDSDKLEPISDLIDKLKDVVENCGQS